MSPSGDAALEGVIKIRQSKTNAFESRASTGKMFQMQKWLCSESTSQRQGITQARRVF
jgi:hypothetical protein